MQKVTVPQEALVLDDKERDRLRFVMDYAYHRATKHQSPVSTKECKEFIEYFRKNM